MPEDVEFEEIDSSVDLFEAAPLALTRAPTPRQATVIAGDRLDEFRESLVAEGETAVGDLTKPWMKFHQFVLVKTVEQVRQIVDSMLEHGRGAIDLETEGLDNRIYYDEEDKPYTVHKIVGFCLGYKGIGHYIPVRHKFDTFYGEKDPNVPSAGVESEIRRLCLASQPVLTEEGLQEDTLASPKIAVPPKVVLYFWHAKFDQEFLYPITGIDFWHPASFEDGMLAAYTTFSDDDSLGLKDKAFQRLQIEDPELKVDGKPVRHPYEMIKFKELFSKGKSNKDMHFADLYPEEGSAVVKYACSDAICTEALCETKKVDWALTQPNLKVHYKEVLTAITDKKFAFTYRLEKQTAQATRVMERPRVKIDKKEIVALLARAEAERDKYSALITSMAEKRGLENFNVGSTKQLSDFLFTSKGLDISPKPEQNAASGQYKTDAATLEKMSENPDAQEVLVWIVKYRQIDKIIGTYLTSMSTNCDANDELRFGFNQTGAATGRFTASAGMPDHGYSGIPIHGIPARSDPKKPEVAHSLRRAFVARKGYTLVKVDYAGQELRVVANLSGEKVWIDEFLNGTGDLHTITAKAFFGQHITKEDKVERTAGKTANFALIYGGGPQAIMRATGCDKVEGTRRKANFDKSVPTFAGWVKTQHANVKKTKGVFTAFGRFIAIPDANVKAGDLDNKGNPIIEADARKIGAACERKSTNFPIQGSGADIMKISMVKLVKEFTKFGWLRHGGDDSVRMLLTVHDEIVFEVKHERLAQAMPVIIATMEFPSKMAKWRVPLIVEPLISQTWEAKLDWHEVMAGKKADGTPVPVPKWLEGTLKPGEEHDTPEAVPPHQVTPLTVSTIVPSGPVNPTKGTLPTYIFALNDTYLTRRSVDLVFEALAASIDPDSRVFLCLKDSQHNILIDPTKRKIPINPQTFSMKLRDKNLGSGDHMYKEDPL